MKMKPFIIIPAYRPDDRLPDLLREIQKQGLENIIVVDDGSGPAYRPVFSLIETLGVTVVTHPENRGKGAALRTGISAALQAVSFENDAAAASVRPTARENSISAAPCVVTADADGQHAPEDIAAVAGALMDHPDALILGTRDFSLDHVPWKSRAGNRISSVFFRLVTGKTCPDTQTGLRGIPSRLLPLALEEEGDRYEYEMNFLTDAAPQAEIRQVPIRTIYENNNKGSHFHPFRDAVRVYARPLRFAAASLLSCGADLLLFALFRSVLLKSNAFSGLSAAAFSASSALSTTAAAFSSPDTLSTAAAVILARLCSGGLNFTLNRKWSFRSNGKCAGETVRYTALFVSVMAASALGTALLALLLPAGAAKILTDAVLFVLSYRAQKEWVFRKNENTKEGLYHVQKNQSHPVRGLSHRLHDIHIA